MKSLDQELIKLIKYEFDPHVVLDALLEIPHDFVKKEVMYPSTGLLFL